MIGASLPYEWLATGEGLLGDVDGVLNALQKSGVESIELRTVFLKHDPAQVLRVAELLWAKGFQITVHVKAHARETAVSEVFDPLSLVLKNLRQENLTVVLHPVKGDNAAMLAELADYRDAHGYPVTVALENNRLLPDKSEGDCAKLVLDAVVAANREGVGICFDMGHYCYYRKRHFPDEAFALPEKEFWGRVVHTHIHALHGLKTHFPLGLFELPLDEILEKLSYGYFGVYNLELDFPRFKDLFEDLPDLLYKSAEFLKGSMPHCARLYDEIREGFDSDFQSALSVFDYNEGSRFALIGASSYLFQTGDFHWCMDPSFRFAYKLAKSPCQVGELLKKLDLIVITHAHADHFEEETVRQLSQNETTWIIPDFMEEKAKSFGILPERMILAHKGEILTVGPLNLRVLAGRHFRPDTGKGTRAYGYVIQAEGQPSMAFPADVRDYSTDGIEPLDADVCFAHVWMGDKSDLADFGEYPNAFASFMLTCSQKRLILAHLYENGRKDHQMWRREHAISVADAAQKQCPDVQITIPALGEVLEL